MTGRLKGKVAVVTGARHRRVAAVALARDRADVAGNDVAGPVSPTLEVAPATPAELEETGRMVRAATIYASVNHRPGRPPAPRRTRQAHKGTALKAPTVSDPIVDTLRNAGVERAQGLSGNSLNGIEDALRSCGAIKWVHVRHEKSAAFAARTASSSSAAAALVELG